MIYLLFILVIFLFFISYLFSKKILSPPCIICGSYCLAIFLAILNINNWSIDLSFKTVVLIIVGLISFLIPSIIICLKNDNNRNNLLSNNINEEDRLNLININQQLVFSFLCIQIFATLLYILYIAKALGINFNLTSFLTKMSVYRASQVTGSSMISLPFYLTQLIKFSKAFLFCLTYVEVNNFVVLTLSKKKYKISKLYLTSLVCFIIQTVFSASRFDLGVFFIYLIMLYYINWHRQNNSTFKKISLGKVIKIIIVLIFIVYLFSATKEFFGRVSDNSTFEYVSRYFGGSIELLDLYVKNPVPKSDVWGKESFYALNNTLYSLGIINQNYTIHLEWRNINGVSIGNVYTAFRMYYQDFGWFGLIILQVLYSIFMTYLFFKILHKKRKNNSIDFLTIIYCYFSYSLFLHSYRDFFYSGIISINYLNILFYILFIKIFLKGKPNNNT